MIFKTESTLFCYDDHDYHHQIILIIIITRYQFSTKPAVPDLNLVRFGRRSSLAAFNLGLRLVEVYEPLCDDYLHIYS